MAVEFQQTAQDNRSDRYLTFMVAGEEYGIDILRIQEIRGLQKATTIPGTPPWVTGVINLRGAAVTVLDLRARFALPPLPAGETGGVIVVLRAADGHAHRALGLVVDAVCDVYDIEPGSLQSEAVDPRSARFVRALAALQDRMLILLNIENLLNEVAGLRLPDARATEG